MIAFILDEILTDLLAFMLKKGVQIVLRERLSSVVFKLTSVFEFDPDSIPWRVF